MARKNNILSRSKDYKISNNIKKNLDFLQTQIDDLYNDTYMNQIYDKKNMETIKDNIDKSIDDLMSKTYSHTSIGKISKLLSKTIPTTSNQNKEVIDALQMFNDVAATENLMSAWMANKYIKDLDFEIDTVLKYMPKLKEALVCKRDLIISADHFAKEFIGFHNLIYGNKKELFNKRMEELSKIYNLAENYEKWYEDAATYGEKLIYISPYKIAFEKVLKDKNLNESTKISILTESDNFNTDNASYSSIDRSIIEAAKEANIGNINLIINKSIFPTSVVEEMALLHKTKTVINKSANTIHYEAVNESEKAEKFDKTVPDDLEFDYEKDTTSSEMIVDKSTKSGKEKRIKIDIPGCIVKELERENVIFQYIDKVCLGYYYLEFKNKNINYYDNPSDFENTTSINTINSIGRMNRDLDSVSESQSKVLNYISSQIANAIDSNFINNNQDLKKEIYMILKHNALFNSKEKINGDISITFIPAEDVTHIKFNEDPVTHRGISDLAYSLFPAKLYSCLYITDVLGRLTRGQDKRVYYVKQNIDTNISKTMLNVLNQIKKGNFGARAMENMSNILNVTGRFNDYIIPLSSGGDAPVQFDIMPGQQFTDNTELMQMLEKMAIDPTDIPYDLIEARQSLDYAIQATMTNSKLMRMVYKRQDSTTRFFSEISTKIYNYEYEESEKISVSLPAPSFLNVSNTAQLIDGVVQFVDKIAEVRLAGQPDGVIAEFRKNALDYYMPPHINLAEIDRIKDKAILDYSSKNISTGEE